MDKKFWTQEIEVLAGQKKFVNNGENALEIEFNIPFSSEKEPDVSEIYIYNLSDSSIEEIKKDGYIIVNAGYKEMANIANILTGTIEEVETEWLSVDKVTRIKATDGGTAWRKIKLNRTYQKNTKASAIMRDLANVLGYEIIKIEPKEDITYKLGKTITSFASRSLEQLAKDTKSKLFINKNRLTIAAEDDGKITGIMLSEDSGLIGTPTVNRDETGDKSIEIDTTENKKQNKKSKLTWKVTSLLNPLFETDGIIKIKSRSINGEYRIVRGRHTNDFNTELVVTEA